MELLETPDDSTARLPFARSYQLEALEQAMKQNTIAFLETGSGKTLISIMLLRSFAYLLRRPTHSNIAVFLVPKVFLVTQQAKVIETWTDLKVGKYWGKMGIDFWEAARWKVEQEQHEVLVMTPQILLDALRRTFIKLDKIKVLIFDECHRAKGKDPYACILKEFYHPQLHTNEVPRIFGMTASLVDSKAKGSESDASYSKEICALETIMNSKVYTCASEAVLAEYISFPNSKIQLYDEEIPDKLQNDLIESVSSLERKHINGLINLRVQASIEGSLTRKLRRLSLTFQYCLGELGLWAAEKAADILSLEETDIVSWNTLDNCGRTTITAFIHDVKKELSANMSSGSSWSISDVKSNLGGRLLTSKVICLAETLLGYRNSEGMRCIIFVERVITAIVLEEILQSLLFQSTGWKAKYIAGNESALKSQSSSEHNKILDDFRNGTVHILVATSILEEGLDVQSCNLVVRFDPSYNVCSFIQSRGRARMQNSDFLLMVKRGDAAELSRVQNYLSSGEIMRKEALSHASLPCQPVEFDEFDEIFYRVPSTGAIVTLNSSVSLIYFYCSRLPSDGYFKPSPRCVFNEDSETCTLQFPNSCPIPSVSVDSKMVKQKLLKRFVCLEACKKLHEIGALTDQLVPDIVEEEGLVQEAENEPYDDNQPSYVPPEFVTSDLSICAAVYHCYLVELQQDFYSEIPLHDIILVFRDELESDVGCMKFDMGVGSGKMSVNMKYAGTIHLTHEQVVHCRQFQVAVLKILKYQNANKLTEELKELFKWDKDIDMPGSHYDYLLLPCQRLHQSSSIDWECIFSASFLSNDVGVSFNRLNIETHHCENVYTKNGYIHPSVLQNCLVCTPHNGYIYCVSGFLDGTNGNSLLTVKDGEIITYKMHYQVRHGIDLVFEKQTMLCGRRVFRPQNYLLSCRQRREKESSDASVELPPELCLVIMSPVSVATFYTFSFAPSIMHRVESWLLSANLRRIILKDCMPNFIIPVPKVLEAITAKHCQEEFHLESLETLGDSFLKYAVCQQLFNSFQNNHEGLLSIKKSKIVSNASLCKLGCQRKISGFIRFEAFDPKSWIIPGDLSGSCVQEEECLTSERKVYIKGNRKMKSKRIADVVEALIGAFLTTGGEVAALSFMNWLGIEVELSCIKYQRIFNIDPYKHVNVSHLQSILNYSFKDPSLLVEALTHGSYMLPEIPRCYQRLEFLGDAVLDHLITIQLYAKYPGMTPGLLTDMRSASVNNECYAQSAIRCGLYKHILHASQILHKQLSATITHSEELSLKSTFGWELDINFPKVLADIIESLAGAIFVDSGYNKDAVIKSIMPLLEPLVTPETLKLQPVRELHHLCQKYHYNRGKPIRSFENGIPSITIEVEANGVIFKHTCTEKDKTLAKKIASRAILKSLKESIPDLCTIMYGGFT
ncbi:endoribonuclease Dicer homolog 2-like [Silene latifolia]|uniref:endoribonuclease Dicer homolog 2-like n=1 Tax=Silene latifolia TaxID=37657 RepID=UPI003D775EA9